MSKNGSNLYSTFKVSNSYMDQSAYVDTVESHITVLTYMYIYIYICVCVYVCIHGSVLESWQGCTINNILR